MKPEPKSAQPQVLSGWKDIANYLGKGVRTVQRYEREFGLPVRRPSSKVKGSVIATRAELDAWVNAGPISNAFRLTRTIVHTQVASFREAIDETRRLHDRMQALGGEVVDAARSMMKSVFCMRDQFNQNKCRESASLPDAQTKRPN